ncbi:hypothetical protein BH23ACT8_BH23ACT8_23770 [soil metagenome]
MTGIVGTEALISRARDQLTELDRAGERLDGTYRVWDRCRR